MSALSSAAISGHGALEVRPGAGAGQPGAEVLEPAVAGGDPSVARPSRRAAPPRAPPGRPPAATGETSAQGAAGRPSAKPCPHWTSRSLTHREVVEALDSLGAHGGADASREADEGLHQRHPGRIGMDALDQVAIELDDVGAHPHHLLQPGVAGAGVVDRDPGAAVPKLRDRSREGLVVRHELVLGDLDHEAGEIGWERLGHRLRGEGRRADVQGQVGVHRAARPAPARRG